MISYHALPVDPSGLQVLHYLVEGANDLRKIRKWIDGLGPEGEAAADLSEIPFVP